jgi:hypothetical protein
MNEWPQGLEVVVISRTSIVLLHALSNRNTNKRSRTLLHNEDVIPP